MLFVRGRQERRHNIFTGGAVCSAGKVGNLHENKQMVWSIDPKTRDTPRDPMVLEIASMFGTRVAETILAAVMCDRDNRPDI